MVRKKKEEEVLGFDDGSTSTPAEEEEPEEETHHQWRERQPEDIVRRLERLESRALDYCTVVGPAEYETATEATEKKSMSLEERIIGAATGTGTGVVAAVREGLAISGSQQVSDRLVQIVHQHVGMHIPIVGTPLGHQIERFAIPALLHLVVSAAPDKIPMAPAIQKTCLRAITGVSKDDADNIIKALMPMLHDIAQIAMRDGGELLGQASEMVKGKKSSGATAHPDQVEARLAILEERLAAEEEAREQTTQGAR